MRPNGITLFKSRRVSLRPSRRQGTGSTTKKTCSRPTNQKETNDEHLPPMLRGILRERRRIHLDPYVPKMRIRSGLDLDRSDLRGRDGLHADPAPRKRTRKDPVAGDLENVRLQLSRSAKNHRVLYTDAHRNRKGAGNEADHRAIRIM